MLYYVLAFNISLKPRTINIPLGIIFAPNYIISYL